MLLSDSLLKLFLYLQDLQILDNNQEKLYYFSSAEVAELADALDSKSSEPRGSCRFDPDLRHQQIPVTFRYNPNKKKFFYLIIIRNNIINHANNYKKIALEGEYMC